MSERIAIVGVACRYPDAESPDQLWENVLAGRRAFRRLPDERMRQEDYWSQDPEAPDRFYSAKAAVLRDYEFDRVGFKVAGSTYRSTDLTHWLALDVAARALADAGFPAAGGLPRESTGVVVGNTLTGEFSRASVMRLRWPYVRRTIAAALAEEGWTDDRAAAFLRTLEDRYKAPFPAIDEDTLAGGLSNTIAGRICNHFDLHGGGYTVDGACSSSLLSVATACNALVSGQLDAAVAGGVDLSIDPFEVIGFAKTGALATGEMRVYDRQSNGFWPGEGCGMLVLLREEDARRRDLRTYALISGWGMSSDGRGGITRPEADGHRLALRRAYDRAGYGLETVSYLEGHGTGTAVGDATELTALSQARREAGPTAPPAALSTIKGNIGHTKAAAGVAGLIKATLAVHHQVVPPATGHVDPHRLLLEERSGVRVPTAAELFPADRPVRAGVSAMGFGGMNTHVALEGLAGPRRDALDSHTTELVASRQDAELLLLDARSLTELRSRAAALAERVAGLAYAELADLAAELGAALSDQPVRAAVIARSPDEAAGRLGRLVDSLDGGARSLFLPAEGAFLGRAGTPARVAFLFPGQGSGRGGRGALRQRFREVDELHRAAALPAGDQVATDVAQPRIVAGSLAGLRVLGRIGVSADVVVGHSLGELTALHWAGALGEAEVLALAGVRGRVMAAAGEGGGAMAGLAAPPDAVEELIAGEPVVVAGYNGPRQTVVSGPADAVDRISRLAGDRGVPATRLNVSHAFHSPLVEPAALAMAERLATVGFAPLRRAVVSTVTAAELPPDTDLAALLVDQVRKPVRFAEAAERAADGADLVVEVGPGRVLTGLLADIAPDAPALALDSESPSLVPLLVVAGAAHAAGVRIRPEGLFGDRLVRPLPPAPRFLASPCEAAPSTAVGLVEAEPAPGRGPAPAVDPVPAAAPTGTAPAGREVSTIDLLIRLAAERAELPPGAVQPDTYPLDDLHLSSITVGQILNQVTRELGRPPMAATATLSTSTIADLARTVDELAETARDGDGAPAEVAGVAPWVRPFSVDWVPAELPRAAASGSPGLWTVHAPAGHPLARPLQQALADAGIGGGVLLCLAADIGAAEVGLLLAAARDALSADASRLVAVQHGLGASGVVKTLHLEDPRVACCLVDLPDVDSADPAAIAESVRRVVAEATAVGDFAEVRYTGGGDRLVPELRVLPEPGGSVGSPLGPTDVLLVTGGGKGITAECALRIATDTGAALALLGRSDPASDPELAANLARMTLAGARHRYVRADVTSAAEVAVAVAEAQAALGPVTGVLHGAGRNEPVGLANLDEPEFVRTLAPKVDGLRAVLAAVDQDALRLLVTFGSIIGRAGLRGEAHYATANDWMTELTVRFGQEHPGCRVLAMEWSVWSGAGMGERLGVVESLMREGINPIPADEGIAVLSRVLGDPGAGPVLVIGGRATGLPTLTLERRELPLLRFVDRVLVHYPGVELVTEADLAAGSDPYLEDHLLDGVQLFPAVIGMEAMAQVASAVSGRAGPLLLEDAEFLRPIVVAPDGTTTVRLAALVRDEETVEVAIRSVETDFGADHFRARLRMPRADLPAPPTPPAVPGLPMVPMDPATELYGGVLFQGKRFQRLSAYRQAGSRRAVAEVSSVSSATWFAAFLAQDLLLADPGTRDAMMHSIQCCVPDATLLPESIERLWLTDRSTVDVPWVLLDARERFQDGDSYVYDLQVTDPSGRPVERWDGLRLRAVRKRGGAGPWVPSLLGPYLSRALERLAPGAAPVVAVEPDPREAPDGNALVSRRARTAVALGRALGRPVEVRYRGDGRPEVDGRAVSASHGAGVTLAAAGSGPLGCDVEAVVGRPDQDWADLLGPELSRLRALLERETGENRSVAATRVWSAMECVRKTGSLRQALTLDSASPDGWVRFSTGAGRVSTVVTTLVGRPEPVVFAVLTGNGEDRDG